MQSRQISPSPAIPVRDRDSIPAKALDVSGLTTGAAPSRAMTALFLAPDIASPLKDGHYGRLRDGSLVGPLHALDPGGVYAYACNGWGWTADGRYNATSDRPHPRDILRVLPKTAG